MSIRQTLIALVAAAVMAWVSVFDARAASAPPSLIDASDLGLRDDLAWLADRGRISLRLTTWPLPLPVVVAALAARTGGEASPADQAAFERVGSALARLRGEAVVGWRVNSARHPSIGSDGAARAEHVAYAQLVGSDEGSSTAWRLRTNAQYHPVDRRSSGVTLDGSYVAVSIADAVVSLGAVDRWWGPARYASPVLGNAAPPVPALTVSRGLDTAPVTPWLAWLGRWNYELSVGRPSDYRPRGPNTIGIRLSTRPSEGLEIGASRYIYWGGDGRPKTFVSLRDALLGNSNIDDPAVDGPDPSNELAGFDLRWSIPTAAATYVAYGHFIGEDEADTAPSKLMGTIGFQVKHADDANRFEWTAESTDTRLGRLFGFGNDNRQTGYQHGTFIDGHYHHGLPNGAFIGGGGLVYSLGLALVPIASEAKLRYEARLWSAKVSEFGPDPIDAAYGSTGKVRGMLLQSSGETGAVRWKVGLSLQHYPAVGRRTAGLVGGVEVALPER